MSTSLGKIHNPSPVLSLKPRSNIPEKKKQSQQNPPKGLPSGKLTYPTWGKGKSSSNMPYQGGYVSSLEGIYFSLKKVNGKKRP